MNKIILLGNIITIIFVVKLESTGISPNERIFEYETLKALRYQVIKEYLQNYHPTTAFEILSNYILNENEMYGFAEHLNRTGNIPEWSIKRQLKNPKSYEQLRYNTYMEINSLHFLQTHKRTIDYALKIFHNLQRFSVGELFKKYIENDVKDQILFEDYLAIVNYLQDESQIDFENLASWRMRRALYTLAIRQYNYNSPSNFIPEKCVISYRTIKRNFADDIKTGDIFKGTTFSICGVNNNSTESLITYYAIIIDPLVRVRLENFVSQAYGILFIILPKVEFCIVNSPSLENSAYEVKESTTLTFSPIFERSNWLTAIANEIENYKQKEREYFYNPNLN
ncbi:uncharacterized protein LOC122512903 isoform X2 [Leptopilina heterotoma]|uniref:uncharacterized protein LOC122512903 isoform X2 n=1 Tax=Leptopilina heterotoma TaxID=63436 RepID=UPI001CA7F90A|nr:uncharacterized protein LOC122512903 isoform X2 [Leptopilina heterotoma]XP_043484984.1 uncharacterized protein LOC122512903 isoform X2 [Leptopilina heterotoma]